MINRGARHPSGTLNGKLSMADASAGLRGETGVTAFPVPLAQAATFDPALVGRMASAIAAEGRGKGFNNLFAPTADITRSWHFGRQSEGFGEDPNLSGALAAASTTALHRGKVLATLKHFAAYTQELDRFVVDAKVSERALHEVYYAPFRTAIEATPLTSVMISYPKINGTYATQNPALFDDLKRLIGLQGYTVPDFWAGDDQVAAAKAGMDLAGLGPGGVKVTADELARNVPATRIDDAARRILSAMFAAGLFDNPLPAPAPVVTTPANQALAHDLAVHSTVLLANRGVLPLAASVRSVAVIGVADTGAITGVSGSTYVDPGTWTTPLQAIRARAGNTVTVTTSPGTLGDVPLPVVPATALPVGLTGTFHAGPTPTGAPVATQTTPTLDFDQAPVTGLPAVWSARWTGTLNPTTTGLHRFSLLASGTAKLVIDGKTIISGTRHTRRFFLGPFDYPLQGTAQLTAGRRVSITIEYTNATAEYGQSALTFGWQPNSLIPAAATAARDANAAVVVVNRVAGEDMDHILIGGDDPDTIHGYGRTITVGAGAGLAGAVLIGNLNDTTSGGGGDDTVHGDAQTVNLGLSAPVTAETSNGTTTGDGTIYGDWETLNSSSGAKAVTSGHRDTIDAGPGDDVLYGDTKNGNFIGLVVGNIDNVDGGIGTDTAEARPSLGTCTNIENEANCEL
ncbi:glycoside hydrolase family 3 N-terminal domain-containing protein [Saccharothrix yanglingensis]|nr:glycoside hydrolase family 3 N-terminal domain-containing protein [Saccharothrix yanglingensis]